MMTGCDFLTCVWPAHYIEPRLGILSLLSVVKTGNLWGRPSLAMWCGIQTGLRMRSQSYLL
jgi:hypothetical protein